MRRARWKRKNVRRVGLRQRRPPAAGGGRLALPCRSQRRKRTALGEPFGPGKSGIHAAPIFAAAGRWLMIGQGNSFCEHRAARSEAERAEREAGQMRSCTPTTSAPSATGRQYRPCRRPKRARRQGQIGAGTDTPTPVQQLCTHVQSCDQSGLFFWTVHCAAVGGFAAYGCGVPLAGTARFLFHKREKKMGGALPSYQHSCFPGQTAATHTSPPDGEKGGFCS